MVGTTQLAPTVIDMGIMEQQGTIVIPFRSISLKQALYLEVISQTPTHPSRVFANEDLHLFR